MPGINGSTKILWIENDADLTNALGGLLQRRLEARGIEIEIVHHKADAMARLKDASRKYCCYNVDVMLPKDQKSLEEVELLEEQRRQALDGIDKVRRESDRSSRSRLTELKKEIERIDKEIDKRTDLEGGVSLFENLPSGPAPFNVLTIFLTARSWRGLKERAAKVIETGKFYWLPKPVSVENIVAIINQHLGE